MNHDHRANAISNGWNFEYAAALFLFLKYISDVKEIGIEKEEDIVLYKKNNHYIVAQAKSSNEYEQIYESSHYEEIKKSLITLNDSNEKLDNVDEFISINNFRKPFGNDSPYSLVGLEERADDYFFLPKKVKDKIDILCNSNNIMLDKNKLIFWFLTYESKDKGYYVKKVLESRLSSFSKYAFAKADTLYCKLLNAISLNGSEKKKKVSSNTLLGILFSTIISGELDSRYVLERAGIDEYEIEEGFDVDIQQFFDSRSQDFSTYTTICASFITYCIDNKITNKVDAYKSYLSTIKDNDIPQYFSSFFDGGEYQILPLYRYFVAYILIKNKLIELIKGAFNVQN